MVRAAAHRRVVARLERDLTEEQDSGSTLESDEPNDEEDGEYNAVLSDLYTREAEIRLGHEIA